MAVSGYLEKKRNREQALMDVATESGMQRVVDYLTLVLHDPQYMGSDTFGRERIDRVIAGITACDKEFADAYTTKPEADVAQDRLDRGLREVYGDELQPFAERQPYIKQLGYKARKEWNR